MASRPAIAAEKSVVCEAWPGNLPPSPAERKTPGQSGMAADASCGPGQHLGRGQPRQTRAGWASLAGGESAWERLLGQRKFGVPRREFTAGRSGPATKSCFALTLLSVSTGTSRSLHGGDRVVIRQSA